MKASTKRLIALLPVLVMVYVPVIILSFLTAWIMSLIGPLKKYVL